MCVISRYERHHYHPFCFGSFTELGELAAAIEYNALEGTSTGPFLRVISRETRPALHALQAHKISCGSF